MRLTVIAATCLFLVASVFGQQKKEATPAGPPAGVLEAKVRQAWEDFKTKNKAGFAAVLEEDFQEAEEDGEGFRDKKAEVAEIDEFELDQYILRDFKVKAIGRDGALVTYVAEYSGKAAGQPVEEKDAVGEVWVRHGNTWKLLSVQETRMR